MKEKVLDETVWGAVAEAMLNPALISEQTGKMRDKQASDERAMSSEAQTVSRALTQAKREEARLLEAYRRGIISPAQLGKELELLKQRQSALEMRSASLSSRGKGTVGTGSRRAAEDYCRIAAERLQTFNEAERQQFLRLLVDTVIFEGEQVRIRAVISQSGIAQLPQSSERQTSEFNRTSNFNIATMNTHSYGHNSVVSNNRIEDIETDSYGHNSVGGNYRIEDKTLHLGGRNPVSGYYAKELLFKGKEQTDYLTFELLKALPQEPFSILSDEGLKLIRLLKLKHRDPTLLELCDWVREERGAEVSLSHMSRALRRIGMSPTRRGPRPSELKQAA